MKNKFTKSDGKSVISKRWHQDIKDTINEYTFDLTKTYYVPELDRSDWSKCEFCGQRHRYVAVIDGTKRYDGTPTISSGVIHKHYEIGFDCLEMVFGRNWNDFYKAERELKGLKLSAKAADRKQKYSVKYEDMIKWFNDLDSTYLSTNRFLLAMKEILETGRKPFSVNMESGVKRFMKSEIATPEYLEKLKRFKEVLIPKIKVTLDLVSTFGTSSSDYQYVKSVYEQSINLNKCSSAQLNHLNTIRQRYLNKPTRTEVIDNSIPF